MPDETDRHLVTLHVSNQSRSATTVSLSILIDDRPIFRPNLAPNDLHTWQTFTTSLPAGSHSIAVGEASTGTSTRGVLQVHASLWVAIAFYGPPYQLRLDMFDHPVSFM